MNIFAVDKCPNISAIALCDQHVNKMILETAQMLSYVSHRYGHHSIYKATGPHKNHPCTVWAGNSYDNWLWLVNHGLALEKEKLFRTGKGHKSADVIRFYRDEECSPDKKLSGLTPFALAMPDIYKQSCPHQSYIDFYLKEKQFFKNNKRPTWTKRSPPSWWYFTEEKNENSNQKVQTLPRGFQPLF